MRHEEDSGDLEGCEYATKISDHKTAKHLSKGSSNLIEEGGGGKLPFIEAGFFEDVHAAMMVHPFPLDDAEPAIIAVQQLNVAYTGRAAHASGYPWQGINAADAMSEEGSFVVVWQSQGQDGSNLGIYGRRLR